MTRLSAAYLALQAALTVLWWAMLATAPSVRERFELLADHRPLLDAFVVADLVIFVAGSALGAWGLWHEARWAPAVVAFTAGGVLYATVVLAGFVGLRPAGGGGGLGLVAMVAAAVVTAAIAVRAARTAS